MTGSVLIENWLPRAASTHAASVDEALAQVTVAGLLALVLFVGLAAVLGRLYRRQDQNQLGAKTGAINPLFLGLWILAAVGLATIALTAGFFGFVGRTVSPSQSTAIDVVVSRDGWQFTHPRGFVDDTLHVEVGQPVDLTLTSLDVEYGLSIPEMRVTQSIVPGVTAQAWFEVTAAGVYDLVNDVMSGDDLTRHSSVIIARDPAAHEDWVLSVDDVFKGRTMAEAGEFLYGRHGCIACHSTNGDQVIGPTFLNLYGHTFDTVEGTAVIADAAYIRESIIDPSVSVIAGFQPLMTSYETQIADREIEAIIEWLKTLSDLGSDETVQEEAR